MGDTFVARCRIYLVNGTRSPILHPSLSHKPRLHVFTKQPDLIQVVLDDASVERLRCAAARRGIEVEQLMVELLHLASFRIDEVLGRPEK
jgi:hypothetical protein